MSQPKDASLVDNNDTYISVQSDLFNDLNLMNNSYGINYPDSTIDLGNITFSSHNLGSYNDTITISDSIYPLSHDMHVTGNASFDGDLKVKGKSITDLIENIEKRLAILHPNLELESKWERLKSLGEEYRNLEKEIIDKQKCWDILKK
jgi:hypothetical protein